MIITKAKQQHIPSVDLWLGLAPRLGLDWNFPFHRASNQLGRKSKLPNPASRSVGRSSCNNYLYLLIKIYKTTISAGCNSECRGNLKGFSLSGSPSGMDWLVALTTFIMRYLFWGFWACYILISCRLINGDNQIIRLWFFFCLIWWHLVVWALTGDWSRLVGVKWALDWWFQLAKSEKKWTICKIDEKSCQTFC